MKSRNLIDVMNDMARQIKGVDDVAYDNVCEAVRSSKTPKNFVEALILHDPVYASLHKQFCESDAELKQVIAQFGDDEPMSEIARDRRDSALSALQTRRIECEADQNLMRDILAALPAENEDYRLACSRQASRKYQQDQAQYKTRQQKHNKALADAEKGFYWTMWAYLLLEQTLDATVRNFKLAQAFAAACTGEQRMRAGVRS